VNLEARNPGEVNQENRNRGNGISEIEGKAARGSGERAWAASEFQSRKILLLFMDSWLPDYFLFFLLFLIFMSVLVDKNTRLRCAGHHGQHGVDFTPGSAWSTAPTWLLASRRGKGGQMFDGKVPVFDTVWEARQKTGCNASMVFVPALARCGFDPRSSLMPELSW